MRLRSIIYLVCIILIANLSLIGCSKSQVDSPAGSTESGNVIKIGAVYPLSGSAAPTGRDCAYGIETAVELINNEYPEIEHMFASTIGIPNLNNATIEMIFADHQGAPETASAEAERLITEHDVSAIIGTFTSATAASVSMICERYGIPFICADASSPTLSQNGYKNFFRVSPHDGQYSEVFFGFLRDIQKKTGTGIKTIAIFAEDSLWGQDCAKLQKEIAEKEGYEVVEVISYPSGQPDLSSEIQRIIAANPDVVIQTAYIADALLSINTYKEFGYAPNLLGNSAGFADASFIPTLGADANYVTTRAAWGPDLALNNEMVRDITELFKKMHGMNMTEMSARAFVSTIVLAEAINQAASDDPSDIREVLKTIEIKGEDLIVPWVGVKFDENGDNIYGTGSLLQIIDGEYRTVWPFNEATAEIVWPIPGWDER